MTIQFYIGGIFNSLVGIVSALVLLVMSGAFNIFQQVFFMEILTVVGNTGSLEILAEMNGLLQGKHQLI